MLEIKNISFSYKEIPTLKNINLNAKNGDNISIIGESGCGKSTLLKLIYGLYDLNEGKILFEQKPIFGPQKNLIPGEDYIKYLAQDFGLMPYITVSENIGKFLSNINPEKKQIRINELLEIVEMSTFANIKTQFLSGGQQQRVALAMVIAKKPKLLLLDEPFSQIDSFRKNNLRRNLFNYLKRNKITCLIATHDINDVLSFSDQTIVLKNGEIIANEQPRILFENPKSKYVGSLFGEINEIHSKYLEPQDVIFSYVLIYSFQLKIAEKSNLKVCVTNNYYRGNYYLIEAFYDGKSLFFNSNCEIEKNTIVYLEFNK
jgi:ABC-type Fe3+/spermidine/putrescine transport system ATPase subunit